MENNRFKVNEFSSGFELEDTVTGKTHWLSDGVDAIEGMTPGDDKFVETWEKSFNDNEDETLEAYFS
jgi:hypothetical protein